MGYALIVLTVPEETLMDENLLDVVDDGTGRREVRVRDLYDWDEYQRLRFSGELRERHPRAYFKLAVHVDDIWDPPAEPRGLRTKAGAPMRREHAAAVRRSLEAFLNAKLARLSGMVRTGWWILAEAAVRVSRFKSVPELRTGTRKPPPTGSY